MSIPSLDKNANSAARLRRNAQKNFAGEGTSAVKVSAPLSNSGTIAVNVDGTTIKITGGNLVVGNIAESQVANLVSDLAAKVPATRLVNTTAPLSGGGALSGDLTLALANQNANRILAGPTSGGAAAPAFRALVASDVPSLNYVLPLDVKVADSNSISNTTAETAFTHSTSFAAGALAVGTYRLTGEILFQAVTASPTMTLNWYLNFNSGSGAKLLLASTGSQTLDAFGAGTWIPYPYTLTITVRSTGVSAQMQIGGNAFIPAPSGNTFHFFGNGPLTCDTTATTNVLQMTATWGTASTTSIIKSTVWTLEYVP